MRLMSYSDREMGRERIAAVGLVALVQGGVIAALVSGLAMSVINTPLDPPLNTYEVPEMVVPPQDPPKPKPEPREQAQTRAQAVPIARDPVVPSQDDSVLIVSREPMVHVDPLPPAPIPAGIPTAPTTNMAKGASPRGNFGAWFPQNSYPPAALRAQAEGRVGVALTVLSTGRVGDCEIVVTSGNADLDQATCRLALKNGRFEPARDTNGNAITARTVLPPVRWRIEK